MSQNRGNTVPPITGIASGLDEFDEEGLPPDEEGLPPDEEGLSPDEEGFPLDEDDGLDFATVVRNKLLKEHKHNETLAEFEVRRDFT